MTKSETPRLKNIFELSIELKRFDCSDKVSNFQLRKKKPRLFQQIALYRWADITIVLLKYELEANR